MYTFFFLPHHCCIIQSCIISIWITAMASTGHFMIKSLLTSPASSVCHSIHTLGSSLALSGTVQVLAISVTLHAISAWNILSISSLKTLFHFLLCGFSQEKPTLSFIFLLGHTISRTPFKTLHILTRQVPSVPYNHLPY